MPPRPARWRKRRKEKAPMANRTKIVFLGATSMSFGLNMLRDIFSSDELQGSTLTLVGRNPQTLSKITELANILNAKSCAGLLVEQTTDRRAALDGAGFVVNATAIDRNRLWKIDFDVPRKYGIRHTLGENGGPGGLFFTLRTLPLVFDFVREMQEHCPNALFVNFFQSRKPHHPCAWKIQPDPGARLMPRHFHEPRRSGPHHGTALRAGRSLGVLVSITSSACSPFAIARPATISIRCCAAGKRITTPALLL